MCKGGKDYKGNDCKHFTIEFHECIFKFYCDICRCRFPTEEKRDSGNHKFKRTKRSKRENCNDLIAKTSSTGGRYYIKKPKPVFVSWHFYCPILVVKYISHVHSFLAPNANFGFFFICDFDFLFGRIRFLPKHFVLMQYLKEKLGKIELIFLDHEI